MKYVKIPGISLPVSRIILGGSGGCFASGGDVGGLIEEALASGINTVDTARVYGKSEEAIGRWLRHGGDRSRLVIISKCCHPSMAFLNRVTERAAEDDLKRSLDALGTDRIDIYLLHRDAPNVPAGRIVEWLNRFREESRIGVFGGSNWSAERIREANDYATGHGMTGFAVSSPHYSLGRQRHDPWGNGCRTVTGETHRDEREWYAAQGMPLIAWSSLCGGVFSGKIKSGEWGRIQAVFGINTRWAYACRDNRERLVRCEKLAAEKGVPVSVIALAYLLCGDIAAMPVIGASSPGRIRENAAAAELELTKEERDWLDLAI